MDAPKKALAWLKSDKDDVVKARIKGKHVMSSGRKKELIILVNKDSLRTGKKIQTNIPAYVVSKNVQFYSEGKKRGDRRIWVFAPHVKGHKVSNGKGKKNPTLKWL